MKIGIIGFGNIGKNHVRDYMAGGWGTNVEVTAILDNTPERLEEAKEMYGDKIKYYENEDEFFTDNEIDGIIVATPHYFHPTLAIKALEHNKHVLVEKPVGVYTKAVKRLYEVAKNKPNKVFGVVFNQRTNPLYRKLKELIESGEIGNIRRINWIITDWYRTQTYYDSGTWRGTWGGEGGGVLINQCPHQLDLFQWLFGMPKKVRGFAHFGENRNIEVEDEVTAYFEYDNGATGVFISSVSEIPGTNRLEIVTDKGKVIVTDSDKIEYFRLEKDEAYYNNREQEIGKAAQFPKPMAWRCEIPYKKSELSQHMLIVKDWISAVVNKTPLLAPGFEAINELEISNAIYLSTFVDDWVSFPIDEDLFLEKLNEKALTSKYKVAKKFD